MNLYRVSFSAADFHNLPEEAQTFFVRMSQARNDIRHISHLMMSGAANVDLYKGIEQRIALHQLLFTVREICASLAEAWKIVKTHWYDGKLDELYGAKLKPVASTALSDLRAYFTKDNLVKKVRNKLGAHYDADVVKRTLATMAGREDQTLVTSRRSGNIFYISAEEVRNLALLSVAEPSLLLPGGYSDAKARAAVIRLYDETLRMFGVLSDFSDDALALIASQCSAKSEPISSNAVSDPHKATSVIFIDEDR